ncbi:MAG: DinB family protein [Hydrogenophaga sp.]|nr:DinB family protein [Hydrogenophaga sp.]
MQKTDSPGAVLRSLFAHKAWANEELFSAIASVDNAANAAQVHNAVRVLNHVFVVDSIFQAHLKGEPHNFEATNTKETPTPQSLLTAVRVLDRWFERYVDGLSSKALHEKLVFRFTDGDTGSMSREEMLMHVIAHGGYHRGAAGEILRGAGVAPPRDLYTRFLHLSEPSRRG